MKIKLTFLLCITLLIQGCASPGPKFPKFTVEVDSISSAQQITSQKYILIPGIKGVKEDDLQYKEYASYVDKALQMQGYIKTNEFDNAEIAIFFGYGIGDPQTEQYSYSVPTWGQTGIASSSTYGTVNSYGGFGSYSGTTTYTPTYGITGATSRIGSRTTYFRYIFLDAVDLEEYRASKQEKQVWKTTVTSTGSSGDLRRVLPILVAASKEYIGTNTGKQVDVQIKETDKRVLEIKGVSTK